MNYQAGSPRTADDMYREALGHLRDLTGNPNAGFRTDQFEAIRTVVADHRRILLVERTGWGKSAVYFIATRMLRARGAGPTLLVSPLLALMRNQLDAARRMGVRAETVNYTNPDEWGRILQRLETGAVDLLLVSAQRLANKEFQTAFLPVVGRRGGLLVIDEAHCISDWGHDFVPDYQRIVRLLDLLPRSVPVICCTATANDRVVVDIERQLGSDFLTVRGPLGRDGLVLQVIHMDSRSERLAWLADHIPRLPGSGIVYCLTKRDTELVAAWLELNGISAVAYSGATISEERERIEQRLLTNSVKVVVATSALGMGFDKPDLPFVIHYQAPGTPIAYYQQVGRAGRALDQSFGVLLCGGEDSDIQDWFIETAFPSREHAELVLDHLARRAEYISVGEIERTVNLPRGRLNHMLKILEVEGAVEREGGRFRRTLNPWRYDAERIDGITAARRVEQAAMVDYQMAENGCRMQRLRLLLDDVNALPCGVCDLCAGPALTRDVDPAAVGSARTFLRTRHLEIEPRSRWMGAAPAKIPVEERAAVGRALSEWGDGGWGDLVRDGKQRDGAFADELVEASARLIAQWEFWPAPSWVAWVPSLRNPDLVASFAQRLSVRLGWPAAQALVKARQTPPQKLMQNSPQQLANVEGAFSVVHPLPSGPCLLVDDVVDSRWTMTAVAALLRRAGCPAVYPFALAVAAGS